MYHSNSFRSVLPAPPKKLQIILVDTTAKNKHSLLEVSYWITISELKRKIEAHFGWPVAKQRLYYKTQELTQSNFSTLLPFGGSKKIKIILRTTLEFDKLYASVKKYETLPKTETLRHLLFAVQEGFNLGLIPKLNSDGTSGSYFLKNKFRKVIALFKPFDEEPMAPNNPRGFADKMGSRGLKPGVLSGESAIREVAAFILDQGFAGVPPTTFVEILHPYFSNRDIKEKEIPDKPSIQLQSFSQFADATKKIIIKHGSLQQFIQNIDGGADDFSYSLFPDAEVRKIAILDLRILNCDRNSGNILVKKEHKSFSLFPIDHGLCLPDCFEATIDDLIWTWWPQVEKPWTHAELEYIRKIDIKSDIEQLSRHFKFRDICLKNYRIAGTVLKKFSAAGVTLHEIAKFIYRDDPEVPSTLEGLIKKTEEFVETMRSELVNDILVRLAQATPKKSKLPSPAKKGFDQELIEDPLAEAYESVRTRAFSFDITKNNDPNPENMLQSILQVSDKGLKENSSTNNTDLYTIPELSRNSISEMRSMQRTFTNLSLSRNRSSVTSKDLDPLEISSEEAEEERGEDHGDFSEELARPTTLKRSTSIPALHTRMFHSGTSVNGKKESPLLKAKPKNNRLTQYAKKNIPVHKDELFFKYFESFLDQYIQITFKSKALPPFRARFLSDY